MNEYFRITDELMQKAKTYMPLADKQVISYQIARHCLISVVDEKEDHDINKILALPAVQGENAPLKAILLQNTLLGFYFDIELDEKKDSYEQYDFYAGGAMINQIERYKVNPLFKEKAFDILTDFKELQRMVYIEIENLKSHYNNPIYRLLSALSVYSTPERVTELAKKLQEEVAKLNVKSDKPEDSGATEKENA